MFFFLNIGNLLFINDNNLIQIKISDRHDKFFCSVSFGRYSEALNLTFPRGHSKSYATKLKLAHQCLIVTVYKNN